MKNPTATEQKADCYSSGERETMEWGQQLRARWLGPLLRFLTKYKASADLITGASLISGLVFIPLVLFGWYIAAIVILALHVMLDGLDGPLARLQGTASPRGSFTDTMADQVVVTGVAIAWLLLDPTQWNIVIGGSFVFLYTLVVAMAMVRNALSVPYAWLVRPRFFFYAALVVDLYWPLGLTFWLFLVSNVMLAIKGWSGFWALRKHLPGPK
ncbi:MAG: CDP-alcohol phosphatidyltransferase family protein, partial [Planctomycetota bacterium]